MQEQKLNLIEEDYGTASNEARDMRRRVILQYNSIAMENLAANKSELCLEMIDRSETLLDEGGNTMLLLLLEHFVASFIHR